MYKELVDHVEPPSLAGHPSIHPSIHPFIHSEGKVAVRQVRTGNPPPDFLFHQSSLITQLTNHVLHPEIALTRTYLELAACICGPDILFCVDCGVCVHLGVKARCRRRLGSGRVPYGAIGIDVTRRTRQCRRGTSYILSSSAMSVA